VNFSLDIELKRIGQKTKEVRLKKNLTQSILASKADVDIRTIQLIERGSLNMSLKVFYSLSTALDINPCELLMNKEIRW
jgi:transcriptional regulator with XRE-family HTH domain